MVINRPLPPVGSQVAVITEAVAFVGRGRLVKSRPPCCRGFHHGGPLHPFQTWKALQDLPLRDLGGFLQRTLILQELQEAISNSFLFNHFMKYCQHLMDRGANSSLSREVKHIY